MATYGHTNLAENYSELCAQLLLDLNFPVHAGLDELAPLDVGLAARVVRLLVPAGADVAVGGHEPILPFSARGSQEGTVSIFASGGKRAFLAVFVPANDTCGGGASGAWILATPGKILQS